MLGNDAAKKLAFVVEQLGLVQVTGLSKDQVRFALDPLAEYLAAMAMLQKCGADKAAWKAELNRLELVIKEGGGRAFAQVLMECCGTELGKVLPPGARARIAGMANPLVTEPALRSSG